MICRINDVIYEYIMESTPRDFILLDYFHNFIFGLSSMVECNVGKREVSTYLLDYNKLVITGY